MNEVVTIGETMVLLTSPGGFGKIKDSPILAKSIGGAESNVAIGLARLGHRVAWLSRIGDDPFGEEILYRLRAEGVNTDQVVIDPKHRTGFMLKQRSYAGEPVVFYFRENSAASHLRKEDICEETIRSARILHITGITMALSRSCREAVWKAVRLAKKNGVKVSFDPNLRLKLWSAEEARLTLMPLIEQCDYFFPGLSEARLLLGDPHIEAESIARYFLAMGIEQIALKLGRDGCLAADRKETVYVKGFDVKEVDAVGAGDGFCAGYLSGLLQNVSLRECAQRGNIVGALAVTDPSDYGGYPTADELERIMRRAETLTR